MFLKGRMNFNGKYTPLTVDLGIALELSTRIQDWREEQDFNAGISCRSVVIQLFIPNQKCLGGHSYIYIMDTISRLDTVRSRKIGKRKTAFRLHVMTLNSPKKHKTQQFCKDIYIYMFLMLDVCNWVDNSCRSWYLGVRLGTWQVTTKSF